ncbi:MAG: InlB B-repeat-containing protein [Cystobacterineae bacterium]|nr:InlB B-repeat-containing protein [Cystobacterineae bacterium]
MKVAESIVPQKNREPQAFPLKGFSRGARCTLLCVLLGAALSACSSSTPETIIEPLEGVYTVIFDKNGGDTEANPQSKTVEPPETSIDELPEAPTREGYKFLGWNTAADGSGAPFTVDTLVRENLTVYAQWENLNISILPSSEILSPIVDGDYNEHSTRFRVVVSGFDNAADASKATLSITHINGLSFEVERNPEGNTQNFEVSVEYNGQAAFPEGFATIKLSLENISGYSAESKNTRIYIRDGQAAGPNRAIPVNQANIGAFNRYATTAAGLTRHYRLTENISLAEPAQPTASNWTAIGTVNAPFMGSLNGDNHELLRLRMRASGSDYQGLFGRIGQGATLENLGLIDASVNGRNYIGSLVGQNYQGTVQNCYATGSVTASEYNIGGLVGSNAGTMQNSYATGSVSSSGNNVGGLLGSNPGGTVQNCYATGNVTSSAHNVGGLVGWSNGLIENSYATGNVTSNSADAGGLVGVNTQSPVRNCYATGSVTGNQEVGGLVGYNHQGTVENSLALNSRVSGNTNVGRVVGNNVHPGSSTDNYAFSGMRNRDNNTTWNNIGLAYIDGANISAELLRRRDGFPEEFLTTPWTYVENRLPGLFGQTVAMPAHIPQ